MFRKPRFHSLVVHIVLGCAVFPVVGCHGSSNDPTAEQAESSHVDRDSAEFDNGRVVMLIRASNDGQYKRIVPIVRAARAAVGDQVVLDLQTAANAASDSGAAVEIWLSPTGSNSMKLLVRLIRALRDADVEFLRVISNSGRDAINCDVYTAEGESYDFLASQRPTVKWYYADWSVESVLAEQTILYDPEIWETLTATRMPLVMLDLTRPDSLVTHRLKSETGSDVVPTFVVKRWQSGSWQRNVLSGNIEKDELLRSIRQSVDLGGDSGGGKATVRKQGSGD